MKQGFFDCYSGDEPVDRLQWRRAVLPEELCAQASALNEKREKLEEQAALPPALRVVQILAIPTSLLLVLTGFSGGNLLPMLLLALIPALLAAGLAVYGSRRRKKTVQAAQELQQQSEILQQSSHRALGIPTTAQQMDIVLRCWNEGDEDRGSIVQLGDYVNQERTVWVQDGCLHLCDGNEVYAFALAALSPFEKLDKKVLLPRWNKAQPPHSAPWKQFHLSVGSGGVYVRPLYESRIGDTPVVLRFPCYEMPTLEAMTGLTVAGGKK